MSPVETLLAEVLAEHHVAIQAQIAALMVGRTDVDIRAALAARDTSAPERTTP